MNRHTALAALALGDVEAECNVCGQVHVFRAAYAWRRVRFGRWFDDSECVPEEYLPCMYKCICSTARKLLAARPKYARARRTADCLDRLASDAVFSAAMLSECEMDDLYHAVRRLRAATSLVACLLAVEPFVDNSGRASAPFEGLAEVVARIAVRTGASTGLFEGQDELLDMECPRSQWALMVDAASVEAEWTQIYAECVHRAIVYLDVCLRDTNHLIDRYPFRISYAFDLFCLRGALLRMNRRIRKLAAVVESPRAASTAAGDSNKTYPS